MTRIVTFGEAMLRFTPPGSRRLEQTDSVDVWVAGAELNVAVGVARLGGSAPWVSCLPRNALARKVEGHARSHGVETSGVHWVDSGRLGLFFTEVGQAPRPSATLYDRAASAFAMLKPGAFDWPPLLHGAHAFHTSGITPALSAACARATEDALGAARRLGCHTSYDLNYRSMLASPEAARGSLDSLAQAIDTVIGSSTEVAAVYGLTGEPSEVAARLRDQLGVPRVVISGRVARPDGTQARRSAVADGDVCELDSPGFKTVDPLGGGDAFSAGLLLGLLNGGARRGLELGGAVAALKQSIPGDFAIVDLAEVEELIGGGEANTRR